jgi:glycosyltransferase involved in cell wall biosynthesis
VDQGGLLVDPYNINELAEAMKQVLTDEKLRTSLTQKGLKQAKKFTWANTARETLSLFN